MDWIHNVGLNATYKIQPNDQVIINGDGCK